MFVIFFLVKNDKPLHSHPKIHSKKMLALTKGTNNFSHDPKTLIFIFSKYKLNKQVETLSFEGLQFSIPPTETECTDLMLPFEIPHFKINLNLFIQCNACLAITGVIKGTSAEQICQELGLESLTSRHKLRKLCHF